MYVLIGTAVYPTLALLNHSCDPNITKYFDGRTVVVVAGKAISKGIINFGKEAKFTLLLWFTQRKIG